MNTYNPSSLPRRIKLKNKAEVDALERHCPVWMYMDLTFFATP
jgi:hypothetical protein